MRDLALRLGAFVFAALLVSTAATTGVVPGASPVGTASAEWVDCDLTDSLIGAAYNTIIGADTDCRWQAGDVIDYDNVTATDAYASALALKDSSESYTTTTGNFMVNTRTVAMSKAKITMVNEINNGSNVSATQEAVNQTVLDYYSRIERDILADWNSKATHLVYLNDGMNATIRVRDYQGRGPYDKNIHLDNGTYQFVNGSTTHYKAIAADDGSLGNHAGLVNSTDGDEATFIRWGYVEIQDPDTGEWTPVLRTDGYASNGDDEAGNSHPADSTLLLGQVETQSQNVLANMDPYVDEVHSQYAAGELNSTDLALIDPSVIGAEASTDFNSTGYYGQAAIMLASIGASGDLNASHTIVVSDGTNETLLNGTLFYTLDDAPAGWDTGTTYNLSDYNGTFYMAVQNNDGSGSVVDLANYGETFTITQAVDTQTGEELNATQVETYTYDSTNASALASELDRLRDLRAEYEESLNGGGSSGGGLNTQLIGGALLVGAAAVLLIQREGNK